jgi:lipoprotein LprG
MTTPRSRTRVGIGLAALLTSALLALSGCSGGGGDSTQTPAQVLSAAKSNLDKTSGVHIALATSNLPKGVDGLLDADGVGTHAPAFEGNIKVAASGITANAAIVAVNGAVYAKLPFTTKFAQIDPGDYGAPDPAALMSSKGGLSSLLTSATDVKKGKQQRNGDVVLSTYTGKVSGDLVSTIIPSASPDGTFDATFTITDANRLNEAVLTGPFYPKSDDVTYTIAFDEYGTTKDIKAP